MPEIYKTCSVFNGFNFRRDKHEMIGHVTSLKIGDKAFTADFSLTKPDDEAEVKVVGVLSDFNWAGGYAEPTSFNFQISITNKNEVALLLHTEIKSLAVEICYNVYEYDRDAKEFYRSVHTNDAALTGLIQIEGEERILYLQDEPGMEVEQPLNFGVVLGVVPEDTAQEIHLAVSTDKKFVKQWGVTRG
jgi:hypothetical protein